MSLSDTLRWFEKAVPEPTHRNISTQLGVHFEEVNEMLCSIHTIDGETLQHLLAARKALHTLSDHFKKGAFFSIPSKVEFLDSIGDQLVTATGSAYMAGTDPVGGLDEINRSNWSKFVDGEPLFDENGKIKKGPNYTRPDLKPFV